jgi:hypothetical protein
VRRSSNRALASLLVVALGLAGGAARADGGREEALIRDGLRLRREHRNEEALALFRKAYEANPAPRTRAQIALAEQSLGQWIAADVDLRAALGASEDPWVTRNRGVLEEALAFVSAHLGWLVVSSNVDGARVSVDGVVVGTTPNLAQVRAVAGTAVVRVEADGYEPAQRSVHVEAGASADEVVALLPARTVCPVAASPARPSQDLGPGRDSPEAVDREAPARAVDLPAPPRETGGAPTASILLAAAGLGLVATGSYFGALTIEEKRERDAKCSGGVCAASAIPLDSEARRSAAIATVAMGAGLTSVAGAAVWWWISSRANRDAPGRAPILPAIGPVGQAGWEVGVAGPIE